MFWPAQNRMTMDQKILTLNNPISPAKVMKKIEGLLERIGLRDNSTGVAFSGGGARGFSHVGVMKAFLRFGIEPNVLAGVSAGSIAAVLYAAGLTPRRDN